MAKHIYKPGDLVTVNRLWSNRDYPRPAQVYTVFAGYQVIVKMEDTGRLQKVSIGQLSEPLTENQYFLEILKNPGAKLKLRNFKHLSLRIRFVLDVFVLFYFKRDICHCWSQGTARATVPSTCLCHRQV